MNKGQPLVSIIVPTYGRESFHERLYKNFLSQTYDSKELCILDDSPTPSLFFTKLQDSRVCYIRENKRISLGEKRNRLINMAKGEVIAHFDDDDLYMPSYLEFMVNALGDNAFVKLSKWFSYYEKEQTFFYWDTTKLSSSHMMVDSKGLKKGINLQENVGSNFLHDTLWGYGFSYVYRKSLYPKIFFDPKDHFGEDLHFVQKLLKGGEACVFVPDDKGLVLHCIHGNNLSKIFPQSLVSSDWAKNVFFSS